MLGLNCRSEWVLLIASQVALLFLTRGEMPHEALWAKWFGEGEGLIPANTLRGPQCGVHLFL
jgi:hypothetical protein